MGWRESYSKPYQWLNYNEALLRARNLGAGLISQGYQPGTNTIIGIYSQNCPEWILTEQAVYCYSMVLVPLYDTLGPDACAFIIKQGILLYNYWSCLLKLLVVAEINVVFVEDDQKCNLLMERSPRCLRKMITYKDIRPATKQRAKNLGIEIVKMSDIEHLGAKSNHNEVVSSLSRL